MEHPLNPGNTEVTAKNLNIRTHDCEIDCLLENIPTDPAMSPLVKIPDVVEKQINGYIGGANAAAVTVGP